MGDKWTTSGRARLKAQQKSGFTTLAHTRPAIAPPPVLVSGNLATNSAKSHPRLRQQSAEGTGSYSTYADPIARRGIAVSLHKQGTHTHHPLHPARRIRNLQERNAVVSQYNPHFRQQQYNQQLFPPGATLPTVPVPPQYAYHSSVSTIADSTEAFPVSYAAMQRHEPSFVCPSQSIYSPRGYVGGFPENLEAPPPFPGQYCIPQTHPFARYSEEELTIYKPSLYGPHDDAYVEEFILPAPSFDNRLPVTENGSQSSEVDMFDRECNTTNSTKTFPIPSKQQQFLGQTFVTPPEQAHERYLASRSHAADYPETSENYSRQKPWETDEQETSVFEDAFELVEHKEESQKRGIDRFRISRQQDQGKAKANANTKMQGLNLPPKQKHSYLPISIGKPNDSLFGAQEFDSFFEFENESTKKTTGQKQGIDRFSKKRSEGEVGNMITNDFEIMQRQPKYQRPATAMARLPSLKRISTKPLLNKSNLPKSPTQELYNAQSDCVKRNVSDKQRCNLFADSSKWNSKPTHDSPVSDDFKPLRFFNEGIEVDIENRSLSRPGSSVRDHHFI